VLIAARPVDRVTLRVGELRVELLVDGATGRSWAVWTWRGRVVLVAPAGEA
jgi:hypothetical protein